jgi:hypothetical protein
VNYNHKSGKVKANAYTLPLEEWVSKLMKNAILYQIALILDPNFNDL